MTVIAGDKRRSNALIATVLFLLSLFAVVAASEDQGIVRDEYFYMEYGTKYANWWADLATFEENTLSQRSIEKNFGGTKATANNREHPPLMKTLFGFSEKLFSSTLGWISRLLGG